MFGWILTIASLLGNLLNCKRIVYGFYIWIAVNTGWFIWDISQGLYSRTVLDFVQTAFCFYGIAEWKKKEKKD